MSEALSIPDEHDEPIHDMSVGAWITTDDVVDDDYWDDDEWDREAC